MASCISGTPSTETITIQYETYDFGNMKVIIEGREVDYGYTFDESPDSIAQGITDALNADTNRFGGLANYITASHSGTGKVTITTQALGPFTADYSIATSVQDGCTYGDNCQKPPRITHTPFSGGHN